MDTKSNSFRLLIIIIAIGIWIIVLQNAGLIPTNQTVYVKGGYIDAGVNGTVNVKGTVDVDNTIDVNLQKINGKSNVFYDHAGDGHYERIPVYPGN
jgi:hypothetical protein